jgi:hypothetical protein
MDTLSVSQEMIGTDGALRIDYDIANVHPIMHIVFKYQSNVSLSGKALTLSTGSDSDSLSWQVMSHRTMLIASQYDAWYSCYCYPVSAGDRLKVSGAKTLSEVMTRHNLTGPKTTGHFSYLSTLPQQSPALPAYGQYWTLAYVLAQLRRQVWTDVSVKANPDNWGDSVRKVPVLFLSTPVLLSTTLSAIEAGAPGQTVQDGSKVYGIDAAFINQSSLNNYMLAASERTRSTSILGISMFNRMIQLKSRVSQPFLTRWNFNYLNNSDFKGDTYILYKTSYNQKNQPYPWTHYFGSL